MNKKPNIIFFGTPDIAVHVLEELKKANLTPDVIVSNPDALVGRKQILTPPPTAQWAKDNDVELFQPPSIKNPEDMNLITSKDWDLFVVVAYGKILPKWLLDLPKHGTLNVHPSLLPELRGASPIRSAILEDKNETGVTIMLMDEALDHGPIIAQEFAGFDESEWPIDGLELDERLSRIGGQLLVETIPEWLDENIDAQEQDHESATFCTKITKQMSELNLDPQRLPGGDKAYRTLLKIRAFAGWPETYFIHKNKRVKIKEAYISKGGKLELLKVIPEGKNEIPFSEYLKTLG